MERETMGEGEESEREMEGGRERLCQRGESER